MVYCVPSSLSFQISFESSVDVSYFLCLKLWQWLYHLVLNVCSVRPMYEWTVPFSCVPDKISNLQGRCHTGERYCPLVHRPYRAHVQDQMVQPVTTARALNTRSTKHPLSFQSLSGSSKMKAPSTPLRGRL